jgi:hypothetical protein
LSTIITSFYSALTEEEEEEEEEEIWHRHPNSEAGNDEIQNVQKESKHGFLFCGNYTF